MRRHRKVDADSQALPRPRFLIPVVALGMLAVLTAWIVAAPGGGHEVARLTPTHATAIPRGATPRIASTGTHQTLTSGVSSGQAASDQSVPDVPPAGTTWQITDTVALPTSPTAGPSSVAGGIPTGFAHSPTGALFAAAQISSRLEIEPNFVALALVDVAPTPGRAKALTDLASIGASNPAHPVPGSYLQLAGFQFVSYTDSTSVIQLLTARYDGSYQVDTLTVTWDGSDWQLVMTPGGEETPNQQVVTSTVGFVVWGGV